MQAKTKPTLAYTVPHNWMFDKDLRVKSEFKLYNLMPGSGFRSRLLRRCHEKGISGYIVFTHSGSRAFGVMSGKRRSITEMKDWLLRTCIPEPFSKRIAFSSYEICFNPNRKNFQVKDTLPQDAKFLGDMDEKYVEGKKCKPGKKSKELGEYADFYNSDFFIDAEKACENDDASTIFNSETT
ncbi:uncharacterized protein LOC108033500 [Drosophila biarmipes]|uniref:uncharacterized protein LOC108033500 n=1 Tax=Drosophila biarmipes TaxID=125945 RepID=UPI0007E685A5|nr:uncharacterized protein LOC108033500 [Drosophila biarmipes]